MRRGSWAAWAAAAGGLLLTACAAAGTGTGGGAAKPSASASARPNIAALRSGIVAAMRQGTPYPLQVSAGANQLSFTDWNTAKLPPLPPASKVTTASQLAAGG